MIKDINTLCIGNLVMLKRERKVVRIEAITKRKIGYHCNLDDPTHLSYARIEEVEPIAITQPIANLILAYNNLITMANWNVDSKLYSFSLANKPVCFQCDCISKVQNIFNVVYSLPLRNDKGFIEELNKLL